MVSEHQPKIICIAEAKMDVTKFDTNWLYSLNLSTSFLHNGTSDRKANIIVMWSTKIDQPNVSEVNHQHITVISNGNLVTFVHAGSLSIERQELWQQVSSFKALAIL